jgi:formate dehydrogenase subunit delta
MNSLERLVYMANQIAKNFATTSHSNAAISTADHIGAYWDPRMRSMIFARLDAGGEGLDPHTREAITILRDRGRPPPQTRATEFNEVDEVGHSDAG